MIRTNGIARARPACSRSQVLLAEGIILGTALGIEQAVVPTTGGATVTTGGATVTTAAITTTLRPRGRAAATLPPSPLGRRAGLGGDDRHGLQGTRLWRALALRQGDASPDRVDRAP